VIHKLYTIDGEFLNFCDDRPFGFTGIVEYGDGDKFWYLNGNAHREEGPAAIRANGSKYWITNGKYHRLDGAAIDLLDGYKEWYVDGNQVTELQCKLLYGVMRLKGML